MLSPASRLLQGVPFTAVYLMHCGNAIAGKPAPTGDPFTSVCLMHRGDAIASKPAPTGDPFTSVCLMHCGDAIAGKPAPTRRSIHLGVPDALR
jgi:hypothetical protein